MASSAYSLVSHDLCPYVQRSVITLLEKDVPFERKDIDLSDKPDWFLAISPLGKVPLLRVGDGVLFESAVICEYLEEVTPGRLHPKDPLEKARHRAWIEFASSLLNDVAALYNAPDREAFHAVKARIEGKFQHLEQALSTGPYFAGAGFSLVDAAYGPLFRYFETFEALAGLDFFAERPKVSRWRAELARRPSVRQAVTADYPARLAKFLGRRDSYLAGLIGDASAAA